MSPKATAPLPFDGPILGRKIESRRDSGLATRWVFYINWTSLTAGVARVDFQQFRKRVQSLVDAGGMKLDEGTENRKNRNGHEDVWAQDKNVVVSALSLDSKRLIVAGCFGLSKWRPALG